MHAYAFATDFVFRRKGIEESVAEVAIADWPLVGLDVGEQVIVREFQDTGQEDEQAAVDGVREILDFGQSGG